MIGRTVTVMEERHVTARVTARRRVTVHVEIADNAIVEEMAQRAARNRTGKSTTMDGYITARVITRSKEIKS